MKRRIKCLSLLLLLGIILIPGKVRAFGTSNDGGGTTFGGCPKCSWLAVGDGLRMALYQYNGSGNPVKKAVINLLSDDAYSDYSNSSMTTSVNLMRFDYQKEGKSVKSMTTHKVDYKKFSDLKNRLGSSHLPSVDLGTAWAAPLSNKIVDFTEGKHDVVKVLIKKWFGLNVDSLSKNEIANFYIVMEPLVVEKNAKTGAKVIATPYEYTKLRETLDGATYTAGYEYNFWTSQGRYITENLFDGMYVSTNTSKRYYEPTSSKVVTDHDYRYDFNNFINENTDKSPVLRTTSETLIDKNTAVNQIDQKNSPFGIGVVWMAADFPKGCDTVCSGKTGDSLLKCAENFCREEDGVNNTSTKTNCITNSCKYTPEVTTCDSTPVFESSNTECLDTSSRNYKSCDLDKSNYTKISCKYTTNIDYPAINPQNLRPGEGFTYEVLAGGSKICTVSFMVKEWKYDYARAYTNDERTALETKLNAYNNMSFGTSFKYNSKNFEITTNIKEQVGGKEITNSNRLDAESKYYYGNDTITHLTSDIQTVKKIKNNSVTNATVKVYTTTNSNTTKYKLRQRCVDNTTSEITEDDSCENGYASYKFFTDSNADMNKNNDVNTSVVYTPYNIKNETNKCFYTTTTKTGCQVVVSPFLSEETILNKNNTTSYTFRLELKDNEPVDDYQYYIGLNKNRSYSTTRTLIKSQKALIKEGGLTDSNGNTHVKIYASVKNKKTGLVTYCDLIYKADAIPNDKCSFDKTTSGNNITYTLKTTKSNAKYYVSTNGIDWVERKTLTFNKNDPYKIYGKITTQTGTYLESCNDRNTDKSCKNLYKPSEYKKIREYCELNYRLDTAGYRSAESCYDDCTRGSGNTCKKLYTCNDYNSIVSYCNNPTNLEKEGVKTSEQCINNCSCSGGNDYYYRVINPTEPFPQRRANANWLGYEKYITQDEKDSTQSRDTNPEYTIKLNKGRLKTIEKDNKRIEYKDKSIDVYNDYIRVNETDVGKYKSKFIHLDKESEGGFRSYFTYINGVKVGD